MFCACTASKFPRQRVVLWSVCTWCIWARTAALVLQDNLSLLLRPILLSDTLRIRLRTYPSITFAPASHCLANLPSDLCLPRYRVQSRILACALEQIQNKHTALWSIITGSKSNRSNPPDFSQTEIPNLIQNEQRRPTKPTASTKTPPDSIQTNDPSPNCFQRHSEQLSSRVPLAFGTF
jgi:hypothetical protein